LENARPAFEFRRGASSDGTLLLKHRYFTSKAALNPRASLARSWRYFVMAPIRVPPTSTDVAIANAVAARTGRPTEEVAQALTWGADEHLLFALAGAWWLYCRNKDARHRRASDHVLLTTIVASALPHVLKTVFDQERPDRTTVRGHWRGIPFSGSRLDSFPSGHAVHVGALASAATVLPKKQRNIVWSVGAALVLTRVVLLAHWASDVMIGLAVGAMTERLLRPLTGYGRKQRHSTNCDL
jgi:membrane-associated phospholipid phosphatase